MKLTLPFYGFFLLIAFGLQSCDFVGTQREASSATQKMAQTSAMRARVAVASNFINPMKELISAFEKQTSYQIVVSYSASGKLYAQIINGAPFHLFLSADQAKPSAIVENNRGTNSHRFTYAIGQLVLWSANNQLIDNSPKVLEQLNFRKLALANPKFAPYGQAAVDVLEKLDLMAKSKPKWVMGESITQAFQFTATGNADLGFISFSQKPKHGSYWVIPESLYTPIKQDVILLNNGKENTAAVAFFEYLKSNEAKNIIQSHHYKVAREAN
ncbi:MAG: molybdate transport system substrate-binding protein [Kangiellaceae bacterium]|jgi:molybdate transport system substrate-binding protein